MKKFNVSWTFVLIVVLPTVIATCYYGLIASDVYVSESRFVVRTAERQISSPLGQILSGSGFSRSQDDTHVVHDYILSRDALSTINASIDLKKAFADDDIDLFSRFGYLDFDNSNENFYRYYQRMVLMKVDAYSSIATLTTRAYSPEVAQKMNQHLLDVSEILVNRLNERSRADLIRYSLKEVEEAGRKSRDAGLALAKFRNEKGIIDPERQANQPLQQIAKLQDELVGIKSQILMLEKIASENPQIPPLRLRESFLLREIEIEKNRVTGSPEGSLAGKAAEYQRLILEKEFVDKILSVAVSGYEQARSEAQRKQLYIERISQPSAPDKSLEPKRIRGILSVLILSLIAWGVAGMFISGIKEHQD
jgi:capsular polysaccharide transport system permease protein